MLGDKDDLFAAERRWRKRRVFGSARPRRGRPILWLFLLGVVVAVWVYGDLQAWILNWLA